MNLELKQEVNAALNTGVTHEELLGIIRRFKDAGLDQRDAYETLQSVWNDLGFDDDPHQNDNPARDELEYVMERVWGFCPEGQSIWGRSLSQPN